MSKLVVLYHDLNPYYGKRNSPYGLLKYLVSEKEIKVNDLEIYDIQELKIAVKDKKLLAKETSVKNLLFLLDEPKTKYLIFTNSIRSKSVPENVIVITSNLKVNQEDGVGNIYLVTDDVRNHISSSRMLESLIKSKLISDKNSLTLRNALNPTKIDKHTKMPTIESTIYKDTLDYLFVNLNKAKNKSTIKLLNSAIKRLLTQESDKYYHLGSSAYVSINSAIRDNKMKMDNCPSYQGLKYIDNLFHKYHEICNGTISYYSTHSVLEDIRSFMRGIISIMLADELGFFVEYPKNKENSSKILYVNDETDIEVSDVGKVLPHMEKYVGYLNTTRNIGLHPTLWLYRNYSENMSNKFLDQIIKNKELSDKTLLRIEYILDNNNFVQNQLQNKVM